MSRIISNSNLMKLFCCLLTFTIGVSTDHLYYANSESMSISVTDLTFEKRTVVSWSGAKYLFLVGTLEYTLPSADLNMTMQIYGQVTIENYYSSFTCTTFFVNGTYYPIWVVQSYNGSSRFDGALGGWNEQLTTDRVSPIDMANNGEWFWDATESTNSTSDDGLTWTLTCAAARSFIGEATLVEGSTS